MAGRQQALAVATFWKQGQGRAQPILRLWPSEDLLPGNRGVGASEIGVKERLVPPRNAPSTAPLRDGGASDPKLRGQFKLGMSSEHALQALDIDSAHDPLVLTRKHR